MDKLDINNILDRDEKSNAIKDILKSFEQNKNNKMAQKCIDMCEDEIATNKKKQDKKIAKTNSQILRCALASGSSKC